MIKSTFTKKTSEMDEAEVAYSQPTFTLIKLLQQYQILVRTLLCSYRGGWFIHTFMGLLLPLTLAFTVRATLGNMDVDRAIFTLGGSMAMSIAFGPTQFLINRLGWAREHREFEYWIALPVRKLNLILAIISVALLFALPGVIGCYVLGTLLFGLSFSGSWLLIILIPLGALPLAGIGAFLGTIAPSGHTASLMGNLMVIFFGFLSPLLIPLDSLPVPLQFISYIVPTTYTADAFRAALSGHIGASFSIDILFLTFSSLAFLSFVNWKLEWRID